MTAEAESPLDPAGLEPATNVVVAGPAMTGKRRVMLDLVGGAADRSGLFVTTKKSAAQLKGEFAEGRDVEAWSLGFVDCVSRQRAVGRVEESERVRYVSSAADLTGIGIELSGFMQRCYHDPDRQRTRVGVHSLSTLLMYADLRRVYQFVHVLTGRIESSGFAGVFSIDRVADDSEAISRLMQLFDGLVETRESPRELRVRGADFGPAEWTRF